MRFSTSARKVRRVLRGLGSLVKQNLGILVQSVIRKSQDMAGRDRTRASKLDQRSGLLTVLTPPGGVVRNMSRSVKWYWYYLHWDSDFPEALWTVQITHQILYIGRLGLPGSTMSAP